MRSLSAELKNMTTSQALNTSRVEEATDEEGGHVQNSTNSANHEVGTF